MTIEPQIDPRDGDFRLASTANHPFFVVGGRYADTSFSDLIEAAPTEGPYVDYDEAVDVWRASSMRHIDEAFVRFLIVEAESAADAAARAEEPPAAAEHPEARSA